MKKALLTRLMLLLCALIAGSSSVWAEDNTAVFTFNTDAGLMALGIAKPESGKATNLSTVANAYTVNGVSMTVTNGSTATRVWNASGTTDLRVYKTTGSLTFSVGGTDVIKSIVLTGSSLAYLSGISVDTWTGSAASVTLTASGTTNIYTITVTYGEAATTVTNPSISGVTPFWQTTEVTITCGTDGATIQYSTDDGANWTDYSAPFTLDATTTIQAKATKSGLTDSEIVSKTFTKGTVLTVSQALTNINALADNETIADQFVTGIVSKIDDYGSNAITYGISDDGTTTSQLEVYKGKGLNGANFSAITDLTVGDEVIINGTLQKYVKNATTTPEFTQGSQILSLITKAKTPTFSPAAGAVADGTEVTISTTTDGATIYYTIDGTDPTTGSSVYSDPIIINNATTLKAIAVKDGFNNSDLAEAEYTITSTPAATPTFSPAAGTYTSAQNVTINTVTDGATIYYTIDGTDPTTGSSVYSSPITVNKDMTIKAIAVKDGLLNSDIAVAAYTILSLIPFVETFNDNNTDKGAKYTGGNDGKWNETNASGDPVYSDNAGWTYGNGYGASQCIKLGTGSAKGSATTPPLAFESGKTYLLTFKAGAWNGTSEKTTLNLSISNGTLSSTSVTMTKGAFTDYSIPVTGTTGAGTITFEANNASSNRFFLDEVQVREAVSVTIGESKYTTFSCGTAVDFSGTDVAAYTAKVVGNVAKLTAIDGNIVPANTGVILGADASGTYTGKVTTGGSVGDNELVAVSSDEAIEYEAGDGKYNYILQSGAFYMATGKKLRAGKAYLNTTYAAPAEAPSLKIEIEGDMTGINAVNGSGLTVNGEYYNLAGQRVAQPTKGLYIVNGKKIVVK